MWEPDIEDKMCLQQNIHGNSHCWPQVASCPQSTYLL